MSPAEWIGVPLALRTDPRNGGRWTSLRGGAREWLWTNPDPVIARARESVRAGDEFVDAGGVEECLPTVRGVPDHGDAWCREWQEGPDRVSVPGVGRLERTTTDIDGALGVRYAVVGEPGTRFLHAVHALLDLSQHARLEIPGRPDVLLLDPEPSWRSWPAGLDRLGPDDGTAICALVPGCRGVRVIDGDDALELTWTAPGHDELCSLLLWRNLVGWPETAPYRTIGIEPTIGRAVDLGAAAPEDCAEIGPDRSFGWTLTIRARRRGGRERAGG